LAFWRPGYRDTSITLRGTTGAVVRQELRLVRVARPCCDLRGRWTITFKLVSASARDPKPTARSVTGPLDLGPEYLPGQSGDNLDSLVRIVRGLHHVDFTPFFGGPVSRHMSTTVTGGGPDLFHEVEASVPAGDSVQITFIPRMSHGSLSLTGRIREDTIRGVWFQNAFCCGATGRFVMIRSARPDTTRALVARTPRHTQFRRTLRVRPPPPEVPAGEAPSSNWQPELQIAPDGRLWIANGGLFVADSFGGVWRRVLGGNSDPVEADELFTGLQIAFVGTKTTLIGLQLRRVPHAPLVYRTADGGHSWSAIILPGVERVEAMSAIDSSVWIAAVVGQHDGEALFRSADGGNTWAEMPLPPTLSWVVLMYRASPATAYIATSGRDGAPALWRTRDAGRHWLPVPTPSTQGLQRLEAHDSRVEQIATIGRWLLVREHGRVFASTDSLTHWQSIEGIGAIASEPGGIAVFALADSLRPELLDANLRVAWKSTVGLPIESGSYIEQPIYRNGVGYVAEGFGSVYQIRRGALRVLRPAADEGNGRPEH